MGDLQTDILAVVCFITLRLIKGFLYYVVLVLFA